MPMDLTNLDIYRDVKRTLPLGRSRVFDALFIDAMGTMTPRSVWEKALQITAENMKRYADRENEAVARESLSR